MATSRTGTAEWKQLRAEVIAAAIERGQTTCAICPTWLEYNHAKLPNSAEVDHIIADAEGGASEATNLRVICRTCNGRLGGKTGAARRTQKKAKQATPRIDAQPTADW